MAEFSVFNARGEVRSDFTDEEIAALSPERQELWATLYAANTAMQGAEATQRDAAVQIDKSVAGLRTAELALSEARPKTSFIAEAKRVSEAHRTGRGVPPDPAVEKQIAKAAAAADHASEALAAAHRARNVADQKVKAARVVFARAIQAWSSNSPVLSQKDLIQQIAATQADRALAEKAMQGEPASRVDALMRTTGGRRGRALEHPNKSRALPSVR